MAQRVGPAARRLADRGLGALGRLAAPALRARSRAAILPCRGTQTLPGLAAPVDVHVDEHGVPHVRASTDADAFRVQGYCHARDRFFQMDLLRRALGGGLAAVVGDRPLRETALGPFAKEGTTVQADRLLRVLDLVPASRRAWEAGDAEERALLQAYVDGVNAALRRMRRARPLEHRLLGLPLAPWRPTDSLLIAKGLALGLSFKWRGAAVFGALAERLRDRPEHLAQVLPPVPGVGAHAVLRCVARGLGQALSFLPANTAPVGSNAWVLGGARSASGKPLLANDPHLDLGLPSVWYLASIVGDRFGAVGATLPGLPGVVIGRTAHVAWGLTNAMLDDADLWAEVLDGRGARYRVDGAWRPLEQETQLIRCRGRAPQILRVRRTHRGPLLTDAFPGYTGPPLSLRLMLHEPTPDLQAFLRLGRAASVPEALEAVRGLGSPAQNLLLADTQGRGAYRLIGRVPRRAQPHHPALPRDGTSSATDWQGVVPADELPAFTLGPWDRVVSANDPPVDAGYPHYLSHLYEPPYRAARITACLDRAGQRSAADMHTLQADATNLAAARFRASILEPYAETVRAQRPTLGPILDRLLAWQGDERADAPGAAPWHLVYHHLIRRTFGAGMGPALLTHWMGLINLVDAALFAAFEREDGVWAPPPVRATLLGEALEDALRDLARRGHGLDTRWGALHTLTLKHALGSSPLLARAFNRGPFPVDGGPYSVCSGQYPHTRPGPVSVGASYRQVVDLADPEGGRMIMPGGQSGHIGSPHYDDLTARWRTGGSVPMRLATLPEPATLLRFVPGS